MSTYAIDNTDSSKFYTKYNSLYSFVFHFFGVYVHSTVRL